MGNLGNFFQLMEGETPEEYVERISKRAEQSLKEEAERVRSLPEAFQFEMMAVPGTDFSLVELNGVEYKVKNEIVKNESWNIYLDLDKMSHLEAENDETNN